LRRHNQNVWPKPCIQPSCKFEANQKHWPSVQAHLKQKVEEHDVIELLECGEDVFSFLREDMTMYQMTQVANWLKKKGYVKTTRKIPQYIKPKEKK